MTILNGTSSGTESGDIYIFSTSKQLILILQWFYDRKLHTLDYLGSTKSKIQDEN